MKRIHTDALVMGCRMVLYSFVLMLSFGARSYAQTVVVQDDKTAAPAAPAAKPDTVDPASAKKDAENKASKPLAPTEITSDTLEYDFNKQVITFTGNVHVVDDQIDLQAKKMDVSLDQKTQTVTRIQAVGDVQVKKQDGRASGQNAIYDLTEGVIILTGKPVIHHPQGDIAGALRVIYERTKGKFRTEGGQPKLRLKGRKESAAVKDFISGAEPDDEAAKPDNVKPDPEATPPPETEPTPEVDPERDGE